MIGNDPDPKWIGLARLAHDDVRSWADKGVNLTVHSWCGGRGRHAEVAGGANARRISDNVVVGDGIDEHSLRRNEIVESLRGPNLPLNFGYLAADDLRTGERQTDGRCIAGHVGAGQRHHIGVVLDMYSYAVIGGHLRSRADGGFATNGDIKQRR